MALGDLIHATKSASGKAIHDPAMTSLKESAKVSRAATAAGSVILATAMAVNSPLTRTR